MCFDWLADDHQYSPPSLGYSAPTPLVSSQVVKRLSVEYQRARELDVNFLLILCSTVTDLHNSREKSFYSGTVVSITIKLIEDVRELK